MPRKQKISRAPKRKPAKRKRAASSNPLNPNIPLTAEARAAGAWFARLVALQQLLRAPNGCPWDREQTHASLRKFLIEETYEVLDALESGDTKHFADELGDLLLQVIFHSVLAAEKNSFTISDVIESVYTKMVRRHPHVFGDTSAKDSKAVLKNWDQIKAEEREASRAGADSQTKSQPAQTDSLLSGVPRSLPAALEADALTRRAAKIGFDWDNLDGILEKIDEEKRELRELTSSSSTSSSQRTKPTARVEEEVGDLLFAAVNVARFLDLDPEVTLKKANQKFKQRFQWMEAEAARTGKPLAELPRERMEELWNESKRK